jgi:hypothetical protein
MKYVYILVLKVHILPLWNLESEPWKAKKGEPERAVVGRLAAGLTAPPPWGASAIAGTTSFRA